MPGKLSTRLLDPWSWIQGGLGFLVFSPLLGAVGLVVAAGLIWQQHYNTLIRRSLWWGFAAWGLGLVITACFAVHPQDAFLGLFNFLPFIGVFAAVRIQLQTPEALRRITWILVLTSAPVVILGLGQQFWGWAGPIHLGLLINWSLEATGNPPGRMSSVFDYANVFASYLVITFTLTLGLGIDTYAAPQTNDLGRRLRLLLLVWIGIGNGMALIFTNSRNAWAIALLVCLAFGVYLGWRWLLGIVSLIAATIWGAAFAPSPWQQWLRWLVPAFFWARLTDQLYPDRPVAQLRTTQWHFAWTLATQRPWTGWGLRNFTALYEQQMHLWLGHPHNLFLMLAAETGIPSAMALFALVGWLVIQACQYLGQKLGSYRDRRLLFTYLVAFLAIALFHSLDITLFDLRVNLLGWLLLATMDGFVAPGQVNGLASLDPDAGDRAIQ
ncbi:O-antigen ligase family protein [Neosynechococcus sphagnicola]|uniref:O-antigen ligase family protein n=1 Tax=Neosynechococcus sphagnicola TaxID=1501145 RepID=UPI000907BDDC|nr:O-antigen ligase family protein [Neosynechococcus sphagnicola]